MGKIKKRRSLPPKQQQIAQTHANLIILVVQAAQNRDYLPQLQPVLTATEKNGWTNLVRIIKKILAGQRDVFLLHGLDDEDSAIIGSILSGIQNPTTLPKSIESANPGMAGSGIAQLIQHAASGHAQALSMLDNMSQQMSLAGGDMARLATLITSMVKGERDPNILCANMGEKGETLILSILEELSSSRLN